MKFKKITKKLKQFKCLIKIGDGETYTICTAILKLSYGSNFILRFENIEYKKGKVKCHNISHVYYNTFQELEDDFKYHYNLCKDNYFTKDITVTI